nr:TadE/TadG family type IV pilus assembly protein [Vannielia litorea]
MRRFARDESGAHLVEFGLAITLMLLILLAVIDFGRMAFHYVTAEKMVQHAARIAAVRGPVCPGVPQTHTRGTATTALRYGSSCSAASGVCADPGTFTCSAQPGEATSEEVWEFLQVSLPNDATMENIVFRYEFDPDLGFLGGPYVPLVTVELTGLDFQFVSPLGELAALAIGQTTAQTEDLGGTIQFPALSATLPGEDLALGTSG